MSGGTGKSHSAPPRPTLRPNSKPNNFFWLSALSLLVFFTARLHLSFDTDHNDTNMMPLPLRLMGMVLSVRVLLGLGADDYRADFGTHLWGMISVE